MRRVRSAADSNSAGCCGTTIDAPLEANRTNALRSVLITTGQGSEVRHSATGSAEILASPDQGRTCYAVFAGRSSFWAIRDKNNFGPSNMAPRLQPAP